MGKVEKVIVLSVLFLVALILVVTITVDDPLDKASVVEAGGKKAAPAVAQMQTPPVATPAATTSPLLNATIPAVPAVPPQAVPSAIVAAQPNVPNAAPAPVATAPVQPVLPPGALLKSVDGLQDSWFPDLKLYTWQEGDSWRVLANRYYGDWQRVDILKRSNEGRMDVQVGERVFIPVFASERTMLASTPNTAPASATPESTPGGMIPVTTGKSSATPGKSTPKATTTPTGKKIHVVASGESLWKIAKAELGDGNRWKEIYEANRDVLAKPESIKKGMRLRIP